MHLYSKLTYYFRVQIEIAIIKTPRKIVSFIKTLDNICYLSGVACVVNKSLVEQNYNGVQRRYNRTVCL